MKGQPAQFFKRPSWSATGWRQARAARRWRERAVSLVAYGGSVRAAPRDNSYRQGLENDCGRNYGNQHNAAWGAAPSWDRSKPGMLCSLYGSGAGTLPEIFQTGRAG